ncbi:MAG: FG-GAP-like repeat-containing protein [Pirellulales bacterium]
MWIKNYFSFPTTTANRTSLTRRGPRRLRVRLEPLEDRRMLSFSPVATYASNGPRAIDAGDFDGDGHTDLVTANQSNDLGLLLNDGDGTLQESVSVSLDGKPGLDVVVGDLNADGTLDLSVTTAGSRISGYFTGYYGGTYPIYTSVGHLKVLLGNGDGSFTSGETKDLGDGRFFSAALGDLDGDGDLDVALSNWDGPDLSVLLGNGDGTFGAPQGWTVGAAAQQVDIADLNGDGKLDLVTTNLYSNVKVLLGNGDGTFQPAQTVSPGGPNAQGQAVGDVNGDGTLDLAVTSFTSNGYSGPYGSYVWYSDVKVMVLLGHGDGTFAAGNGYLVDELPLEPLALVDIDGDGKLDIVAASYDSGNVSVLRGVGDGTFLPAQTYSTGGGGGGPADIVVVDLNGDAALDVAAANYGYNTLKVFLNTNGVDPPPPPPSMSISDAVVTEGHTGTAAAIFTVTLSAAAAGPVAVTYATANGIAVANGDYQATTGSLSFAPGETSKTLTIQVNGDTLAEADETFLVNLSNASGATIADVQGVGTILDDDPRVSISDVSRNEGNSGTTKFVFTVSLSATSNVPVTVDYATANGTAKKNDNDYVAKSGKLTFAPGETSKTITVVVKGDHKKETHESFYVNLANAKGALLDDYQAEGTILNDDTGRRGNHWLAFSWAAMEDAMDDFLDGRRRRGR